MRKKEIQRCSGTQFDPKVVEDVSSKMHSTLWTELREKHSARRTVFPN